MTHLRVVQIRLDHALRVALVVQVVTTHYYGNTRVSLPVVARAVYDLVEHINYPALRVDADADEEVGFHLPQGSDASVVGARGAGDAACLRLRSENASGIIGIAIE